MAPPANLRARGRTVRLSIPVHVAADLGKFQSTLKGLAERLGCENCFSGANCLFELERNFLVNENLDVVPNHNFGDPNPQPDVSGGPQPEPPTFNFGEPSPRPNIFNGIDVVAPGKVSNNLDNLLRAVANIAEVIGCKACCSGFDLLLREELSHVVNPDGSIHGVG